MESHSGDAGSYLKLGADANSRARQARLVAAYDIRKNTEVTGAIAFREPINKMHWNKNTTCYLE